ncbi:hypothetical protein PMAYCL1PPCAC_27688, partial [Pristionchus mayeri]
IIGPVTTLVIEDDVNVELTLTSFQDKQFISAQPGFSFSVITSGRANDMQSSRPAILVSTAYGINDDNIDYEPISITGTVKMDENQNTGLLIDCCQNGNMTSAEYITETRDVIINDNCNALDITYLGSLDPEKIYRSDEVIYFRIESNANPLMKTTTSEPALIVTTTPGLKSTTS